MQHFKSSLFQRLLGVTILVSLSTSACNQSPEATAPAALSVKLETLETTTIRESSEFVGSLEADQRVSLAPRIQGRIIEVYVENGTPVTKGTPIIRLDPDQQTSEVDSRRSAVLARQAELSSAQAELGTAEAERARSEAEVGSARSDLQDAEARLELAKINFQRTEFLVAQGVQPQQQLDENRRDLDTATAQRQSRQEILNAQQRALEASEQRINQSRANIARAEAQVQEAQANVDLVNVGLQDNEVLAPIDGIVGDLPVRVGDFVGVGQELTTITNNDKMSIRVSVPIERLSQLRVGLPVETVKADGSIGITGSVTSISPTVDQATQTVLAKISFDNDGTLKDSEFVRVRLIWDERPGLLLPTAATTNIGNQRFVYVAVNRDAKQVVEQRPVEVGGIEGQAFQVISGVEAGEQIAVSRILDLRDGREIVAESAQSQN